MEIWSSVVTKQQHRSRGRLLAIIALAQHLLQYTSLMFPKSLSNHLTDPVCDVAYLGTWVLLGSCVRNRVTTPINATSGIGNHPIPWYNTPHHKIQSMISIGITHCAEK